MQMPIKDMDLKAMTPLVIYDDRCYLCVKFAMILDALAGKRLGIVGHYSKTGKKLRLEILDSSALEMFWFVDARTAYGGRAALLPLAKAILFARGDRRGGIKADRYCDTECRNVKSVFLRSASLFSHSKKIRID